MIRRERHSLPVTAETWLVYLSSRECDAADRDAFARWHDADPAHAAAYREVSRLHESAALLRDDPLLRAAAKSALRRTAAARQRRPGWRTVVPLAAAAVLALAFGVTRWRDNSGAGVIEQHLAGIPGGIRTSRLPDGTTLVLDVGSAVSVHFDGRRRTVILERGRAQFVVAHGEVPFEVRAQENVIRDVGTTFQVSEAEGGITVGLLEGAVAVSRRDGGGVRTLAPAQQIHIAADGSTAGVQPMDTDIARGWTSGELVFRQRRLDDLVATMNRYADTQVRLGEPALGALQVSGSFHAGDQQALVLALQAGWSLQVERGTQGDFVLYSPHRKGGRAEDRRH